MKIMTKTSSASLKTKFKYCYKIKRSNNYQAVFKNKGKQIYVGTFDSVLKAAIAADYKRVELGFDRNKLNFPEKYEIFQRAIRNETTLIPSGNDETNDIYKFRPRPVDLTKNAKYFKVTPDGKRRYCGGFALGKCNNKNGYKGIHTVAKGSIKKGYYIQIWQHGKTIKVKNNHYKRKLDAAIAFDINTIRLTGRGKEYLNFPEEYQNYINKIKHSTEKEENGNEEGSKHSIQDEVAQQSFTDDGMQMKSKGNNRRVSVAL